MKTILILSAMFAWTIGTPQYQSKAKLKELPEIMKYNVQHAELSISEDLSIEYIEKPENTLSYENERFIFNHCKVGIQDIEVENDLVFKVILTCKNKGCILLANEPPLNSTYFSFSSAKLATDLRYILYTFKRWLSLRGLIIFNTLTGGYC